jgi:hypothetical protein
MVREVRELEKDMKRNEKNTRQKRQIKVEFIKGCKNEKNIVCFFGNFCCKLCIY